MGIFPIEILFTFVQALISLNLEIEEIVNDNTSSVHVISSLYNIFK